MKISGPSAAVWRFPATQSKVGSQSAVLVLFVTLVLCFFSVSAQGLQDAPGSRQGLPQQQPDTVDPAALLNEAVSVIRSRYYDRDQIEGEAFQLAVADATQRLQDQLVKGSDSSAIEIVHDLIRSLLRGLTGSHASLVPSEVYLRDVANEMYSRPSRRFGLKLVELDTEEGHGLFVSDVHAGGPSERAGILRGDRLVSINGESAEDSSRLLESGGDVDQHTKYSLSAGASREAVTLQLERQRGPAGRFKVRLQAQVYALWQAVGASARIVESHPGLRIGTLRLYHVLSGHMRKTLERAMRGLFQDADALVIDLRGRGGLPAEVFAILELFESGDKGIWKRPVVFLIDRDTRSAKEVLAFHVQDRRLGLVVGERTAGAVLAAHFDRLADGSVLMLPRRNVRDLSGGVDLEGVGVKPDVAVNRLDLRWSRGADSIMDRGLRVAASQVALARSGLAPGRDR